MANIGRPRHPDIGRNILQAVAELAPQVGYSNLTVEQIAARAGTSKPAFYRRFRDIADTVPALLAEQFGTDEDVDTGSIASDLLEIQIRQCRLFDHPLTRSALPGYLDYISTRPEVGLPFVMQYLAPRRAFTGVLLARAVERGEISPYENSAFVADLLTGPVIMRGLLPFMPPIDADLIASTVGVVLDEVGFTGDRSVLDHVDYVSEYTPPALPTDPSSEG